MTTTPDPEAAVGASTAPAIPARSWWRRPGRPAWSLPVRAGIALLAMILYTWALSKNGMGNSYYAAAVKSGSESWKAFFFGALDPGSFITVDKPPVSFWAMALSGRVFGFSSWSMLVPNALAGVASVLIVYRVVRRWAGEVAAALASLALALTPIAVVMFRLNSPDAFLTLFLVAAAWALWSALESAQTSRLVLCGVLLGTAFLTKSLAAFVVLPGFGLVYLLCGPPRLARRVGQLCWAGLALLVASAWWVVVVELWPASSRPYIGDTTNNSEVSLIFGSNGFSRLFGSGGVVSGGGGVSFGGRPGLLRMFNNEVGGQVAWLIPLAFVGLVAVLWQSRHAPRTSLFRAGFVLWAGWVLGTMIVFSETQGIFHPYYTVALAPAIAALAAAGAVSLWRFARESRWWAAVLPLAVLGSACWAAALLGRTPRYDRGLSTAIIVGGAVAAVGLALVLFRALPAGWLAILTGALATSALLAGPSAYALTSINQTASGALAAAGPATVGGVGATLTVGRPGRRPSGFRIPAQLERILSRRGFAALSSGIAADSRLVGYLTSHRGTSKYLVAVSGSMAAAPIILAAGKPVIAMGGFSGSDPAPTLKQFQHLVVTGQVHYVLVGGTGGPGGAFPAGGPIPDFSPRGANPPGQFPGLPGPNRREGSLSGLPGFRPGAGGRAIRGNTVTSVLQWVQRHGQRVAPAAYGATTGSLYYVSSRAAKG